MIADVVAWSIKDEMPFDELQEAINWVVSELIEERGDYANSYRPEDWVHLKYFQVYDDTQRRYGKLIGFHRLDTEVIVVSDTEIDEDKAREVYQKYLDQLKEVDADGAGRSGRDDGQPSDAPSEQSTVIVEQTTVERREQRPVEAQEGVASLSIVDCSLSGSDPDDDSWRYPNN